MISQFFDRYVSDLKRRAILREGSIDDLRDAGEIDYSDVGRIAQAKTRGDDREPVRPAGDAELVVVGSDEKNHFLVPIVQSLAPLSTDFVVLPSLSRRNNRFGSGPGRGAAAGLIGASLTYLDTRTVFQLRKRAVSFVESELSDEDKGTVRAWAKRQIS